MSSAALSRLAERLHVDPERIAYVGRLDDSRIDAFATLVADAQARDEQSIEEGLQETLRFFPRPLRGRAQKMLFPEEG